MAPEKILFICIHNSARSQMAQAYVNYFGKKKFTAQSAGLEPGKLNPIVVEVMKEDGIDISQNKTNSVFDFFKQGRKYNYVIAVCDKTAYEQCPVFPGIVTGGRLHWPFKDPSGLTGTYEEKLQNTRLIRDEIKTKVRQWLKSIKE
ncbi:arsenate reductase ArsC [bacterium]|nr:arsenate reductase ArsC [bacterium]